MSCFVLSCLTLMSYYLSECEKCYNVLRKIDLDLSCMRNYEQRGCYLKLLQYLYCLLSMSPDVTGILSKMQNISLKYVQLVGMVTACEPDFVGAPVCVLFYLVIFAMLLLFMISCVGPKCLGIETIANIV